MVWKKRIQKRGWRWSFIQSSQPTSVQYAAENTILGHLLANKCGHLVSQPLVLPLVVYFLHSWESHLSKIKIWLCQFLHKQNLTAFGINSFVAASGPWWSGSCLSHQQHFSPPPHMYPGGQALRAACISSHAAMFSNLHMVSFLGAFFPLFPLANSYIYP